jgi:hypothetical protein
LEKYQTLIPLSTKKGVEMRGKQKRNLKHAKLSFLLFLSVLFRHHSEKKQNKSCPLQPLPHFDISAV